MTPSRRIQPHIAETSIGQQGRRPRNAPVSRGTPTGARHLVDTGLGSTDKQGSAWLRWVLNQAAQTAKRSPGFSVTYAAIAKRRGKKIATIAVARKLLTRAYHLLAAAQAAQEPDTAVTAITAGTAITRTETGRVTKPRASSPMRHEPATGRARSFD